MTVKYQIEKQWYEGRYTKFEPTIDLYDTLEDAIKAGLDMPKSPGWTGKWIVKRITMDESIFYYKKEQVATGL